MPNILGSAIFTLETDDSRFVSGLNRAESQAKGTGERIGAALGAVGKTVAIGLAAGTAALGAGLVSSVHAAEAFEHQIDQVGAVANATEAEMKGLADTALRIGKDTAFSATEAAQAMEELAANGLTVAQIMDGAADAAVALAAAGGTDLATAADIASTSMSVWGIEAKDMTDVVNRLAGAANTSRFGVEDMGAAIAQGGAAARLGGVEFADFATSIAATAQNFSSGSDAGTAFKTFISGLTPSTKPAIQAMKQLGIVTEDGSNRFFDAQGNMKGMAEVTQILHDATKDLSEEQKTQALSTIFGNDALRTAAGLANLTGDEFRELQQTMGNTQAADVAAKRMGNFRGALESLKGSIETIQIEIGLRFLPTLARLARFAADALPRAFDATTRMLSGPLTTAARVAEGVFRMFTGRMGTGALEITRAFQQAFGPSTGRMLSDFVQGAVRGIQGVIDVGRDLARGDFGAAFTRIADAARNIDWGAVAGAIRSGLSTALSTLGDIAGGAANLAVSLGGWLLGQVRSIDWGAVGSAISTGVTDAVNFVGEIGGKVWRWVSDQVGGIDWSAIGGAIMNGITAAAAAVQANWGPVADAIRAGIRDALSQADRFIQAAADVVNSLAAKLEGSDWSPVGRAVGKALASSLTGEETYSEAGQNVADGITLGTIKALGDSVARILNALQSKFNELGVGMHDELAKALGEIDWSDVAGNVASHFFGRLKENIQRDTGEFGAAIRAAFVGVIRDIVTDLDRAFSGIKSAFSNLTKGNFADAARDIKEVRDALADVGKVEIPPKTVEVKGDTSDFDAKGRAVGSTFFDPKTVEVNADPGPFEGAAAEVDARQFDDKTTTIQGNPSPFEGAAADVDARQFDPKTVDMYGNPADALSDISSVHGAVNAVPKSFTVTAYVDVGQANAALDHLARSLPHSPAEIGPLSELPNWDALFEELPVVAEERIDEAVDTLAELPAAFEDIDQQIGEAATRAIDPLRSILLEAADVERLWSDMVRRIGDIPTGQLFRDLVAGLEAAQRQLRAAVEAGAPEAVIEGLQRALGEAELRMQMLGQLMTTSVAQGMLAGVPAIDDMVQRVRDAISGDAWDELAQRAEEIGQTIAFAQAAGWGDEVIGALQAEMADVQARMTELGGDMALAFQAGLRQVSVEDVLDRVQDAITGSRRDELEARAKELGQAIAFAQAAGWGDDVVAALETELLDVQDRLANVSDDIATAMRAGLIEIVEPLSDEVLAQISDLIDTLEDEGQSLIPGLVDAIADGRASMDQIAEMIDADLIPTLEDLEKRLTVDLAQALLDGTDPSGIQRNLEIIDQLLERAGANVRKAVSAWEFNEIGGNSHAMTGFPGVIGSNLTGGGDIRLMQEGAKFGQLLDFGNAPGIAALGMNGMSMPTIENNIEVNVNIGGHDVVHVMDVIENQQAAASVDLAGSLPA